MSNNLKLEELYKTFRHNLLEVKLSLIEMSWGDNEEYSKKAYVEAIIKKNMKPPKPYLLYSDTVL